MNILLVEDNEGVRNSLTDFIQSFDHQIVTCENGLIAIQHLQKQQDIHLVLSDIMMPEMDGHQLLSKIKESETLRHIEVVLFTGFGDVKGAVKAMRNGAYDYLLKPVDVNELDLILRRIQEIIGLREENRRLTEDFQGEVLKATETMQDELKATRKAFARQVSAEEIGIYSETMHEIFKTAAKLHHNPDVPVLIEGETGTGKEVIARFIHYGEGDIISPFIGINCAAINVNLFESELFGYEAGAFTGGNPKGQRGKLELAEDGSLFLDEMTEMPLELQAKLLRVLQEREFYRVGGLRKKTTKARFICATNQAVKNLVDQGSFRQDLYYRLHIGYVRIPPLRERSEEIIPLAELFLRQLQGKKHTRFKTIDPDAKEMLLTYHWPGNIRELKNTLERIVLYWSGDAISTEHIEYCFNSIPSKEMITPAGLDINDPPLPETGFDLNQVTLNLVQKALDKHHGNQTHTAKYLGISVRVLHTYLKKLSQI